MLTKPENQKLGVFSGTYLCKVSQERKRLNNIRDKFFLKNLLIAFKSLQIILSNKSKQYFFRPVKVLQQSTIMIPLNFVCENTSKQAEINQCLSGYTNDHGLFIKVLVITGKNGMITFTRVRTSKLLITFIKVKAEKREI